MDSLKYSHQVIFKASTLTSKIEEEITQACNDHQQ